ncbi:MAG: hypothetical protein A2Z49_05735 [Chloroflexi bacterium RBG_19FT_COMBO_56_12]|nr:MAG: hypothetical protein A2Z49_05735 [Chloroflexi bacterium RBG_19FT_COMBO_56_12]
MTIIQDQLDFIKSPNTVVKRLATDPRAAFVGLRNVLAIAVLYEIAILLWAFGADSLTLPALLRIPEQQYYFYELVFLIPLFLFTWLLASGIAYLMFKAMGGSGSFDAILGGFGLTMAVSAYFTLIPDYVQGVLWTTGWVPFPEYQELTGRGILLIVVWAYLLAYVLAHLLLYSVTVQHTQGLNRTRSAFVAFVSFIGSFAVWITFVR